jgi:hypothetical protein
MVSKNPGHGGRIRGNLVDVTNEADITWLSVPDVCKRLSLTPGKVHRLVEDRALLGRKDDGVFRIPEIFLVESTPVPDLKGTALVLIDGGFSPETALEWLLEPHDVLGTSPIDAIRNGRKTEVRRLAQTLAL